MNDCQPGQRWISNTEPELGLGMVFEVANRRVIINFPAADDRRTYALDNSPLIRVLYRAGDRIRGEDGTEFIVTEVKFVNGCAFYIGINAEGGDMSMHEIDLDSFVQFNRPLDRLFIGQVDKAARFRLRAQTLAHHHRHQVSPAYGLLGARVQPLPHQFYIADEVSGRHAPRVLLADEVGLGKTIEAGLILHRQWLSGRVARALVVVPDNLVHQWLVEMLRRFNLRFSILDEEICDELADSGEGNPFESAQLVLTSLSFLVGDPERHAQACAAGWDLLVVDEAHHLAWTPAAVSPAYAAVAALAERVPSLLLLTATPEQLGVEGHFARLRLLDPHRYDDLERYLAEEKHYEAVSELVRELREGDGVAGGAVMDEVARYLGAERVAELESELARDRDTGTQRIVRELLDHHGTGRVLFRNCRDNIAGFPERRLNLHELDMPTVYRERAAQASLAAQLIPEQGLGEDWLAFDPRAEWLAGWLAQHRRDKTLVICARADTAQTLEAWLRLRKGVRSAVFHEGLDLVARDRAAAYFADTEEDAQLLVCSEIGSEGRNFQFARHLVLFDIPENPDLIEQRIGRLDRIGQRFAVEIHVPMFRDSAQSVLVRWLHEGIDAFEHICPAGPALLAEFRAPLEACMAAPADAAALTALLAGTRARSDEIRQVLSRGRDRLLELNSFDRARAEVVLASVSEAERADELRDYMDHVFSEFGVEHEDNGEHSLVLQPGDHMSCTEFPGLPEGGLTVTFDRTQALGRDDMHFLSWEHPMVAGSMDMVLGGDFGNASFGVIKVAGVAPGSLFIESQFVVVCPAPRGLNVQRFLPRSSLRVVVDGAGEDVSARRDAAWFDAAVRDVPSATALKVVTRMREQVTTLTDHATHFAEVQQEQLVGVALEAMNAQLEAETARMQRLAKVNPNIRAEEVSVLEDTREQLARYLKGAQLKLDAVRVVVAT
ncbi:MAG: RNA polymerase-associated protein RapA [Proteobacteria bacterium]|nr:RNA polymerase-associated protein RapA [Pseudomonadota bacterium]